MENKLEILTNSAEQTQTIGLYIGENAQEGDIFLLSGELGTGKTCLTQGIAAGLGVTGYVRSPTFVLMTQYQGRLVLHHMDLYRIDDEFQAWDLGIEDQLTANDVCVIEWAERASSILPEESLWIDLKYGPNNDSRSLSFYGPSPRFDLIFNKLRETSQVKGQN